MPVRMELQLPKGTRDLIPEQLIIRNRLASTLKRIFELYGYYPMDTPVFERYDVLSSKYAGGSEILKEIFKLTDQGKRDLALRYDLTVPMCRFVGMNPNLKMPFKRYQIGEVFRDGPVQMARYRQFTQCDVDIFGLKDIACESELLTLASRFFSELKLEFEIRVNNRKLLNDILAYCKVGNDKLSDVILSIDKMEKIGFDGVAKELKEKNINENIISNIKGIITLEGTNAEKLRKLKEIINESEGIDELERLLGYFGNAVIDISLARGLSYYTGTIIEIFLKNSSVKSAVCAGGRFDRMVGDFLGRGSYPAVGISFGLDRIYDAYIGKNAAMQKTVTQVYVIPIGTYAKSTLIAENLRNAGLNVEIDLASRGPSKNLAYANSLKIPYVIFIGEDELKSGTVKLKDMATGEEKMLTQEEVVICLEGKGTGIMSSRPGAFFSGL